MEDTLLTSFLLTDDVKVDIYQQGRRRKYAIYLEKISTDSSTYKKDWTYKSKKYDISSSDINILNDSISIFTNLKSKENGYYKVVENNYKEEIVPLETFTTTGNQSTLSGPTQSTNRLKLNVVGLPSFINIKVGMDLPNFSVFLEKKIT